MNSRHGLNIFLNSNRSNMKILWFTNTPCGASFKLISNTPSCGWLYSLESILKTIPEIDLHIAFYYKERLNDFYYNGVHYYPIYDDRNASRLKTLFYNYTENFLGFKNHDITKLKRITDKVKPDLIHFHGTEMDYGLLQKMTPNIPSVISIQGVLNSCYEKLFSGINKLEYIKHESLFSKITLQTIRISEKRFAYNAKREIEILQLSKHVIGRTDFDRHTTLAIAPHAQYYIGNEILREEFYSATWHKAAFNKQFTIVTTISSGSYKGLEVIIRTAINLKRIHFPFRWIVIGLTEHSRDALVIRKWLKQSFSENNIEMKGKKDAKEIVNILQESDVYCQTGHIENSPNSLCEAMLMGMPIIASYAGGTSSMLDHDKEGYLLQDGDSFSLAGTIIEVSQNFQKAQSWGKSARIRALNRHDPQKVAKEYINIYHQIISNK